MRADRRTFCIASAALLAASLLGCRKPPVLAPGQVWSYKTRPREGASTVQILHIEPGTPLGDVMVVSVRGLSSGKGGRLWATEIWPLVFTREALEKSLTTYQYSEPVRRPFLDKLDRWNTAARAGRAAAEERTFLVTVAEALNDLDIERPGAARKRFSEA